MESHPHQKDIRVVYQSLYASTKTTSGYDAFIGSIGSTNAFHKGVKKTNYAQFKDSGAQLELQPFGKTHLSTLQKDYKGDMFTLELVKNLLGYSLNGSPPDVICLGECMFTEYSVEASDSYKFQIKDEIYELKAHRGDTANNAFAVWVRMGSVVNNPHIHIEQDYVVFAPNTDQPSVNYLFVHTPNKICNDAEKLQTHYAPIIDHYKIGAIMGDTNQCDWGFLAKTLGGEELKRSKSLTGIRDDVHVDGNPYDTVVLPQNQGSNEHGVWKLGDNLYFKNEGYTRVFFPKDASDLDKGFFVVTDHMGIYTRFATDPADLEHHLSTTDKNAFIHIKHTHDLGAAAEDEEEFREESVSLEKGEAVIGDHHNHHYNHPSLNLFRDNEDSVKSSHINHLRGSDSSRESLLEDGALSLSGVGAVDVLAEMAG